MEEPALGLRERKKQRTRQALTDAALELFAERGFDGVTVADIAAAAEVSPRTFFSYFPSKEDVLLGESEDRFDLLADAVAQRGPGEPVLRAVQRALPVMLGHALGGSPDRLRTRAEVILANPAILGRLRQRLGAWEERLTDVLLAEARHGHRDGHAGDGATDARDGEAQAREAVEARVVAAALVGAARAFVEVMMHSPLDDPPEVLRARSEDLLERAFGLLERGLADYGSGRAGRTPAGAPEGA